MKNKTKTYLLLAAFIGIWGTIGYKVINGLSTDDIAEVNLGNFDTSFNPKTNTEVDTFSIGDLERDPFLGTLSQKKKNTITKSSKKVVENTPLMTYNGLVKKQNTSDQVFVVNINNQQYLLKSGQVADSVKLVKGNGDEITIRFRNKSKILKRQ